MDSEQILTQTMITVFTIVFVFFACWTKTKIEKKYRQIRENLERSRSKMETVQTEEYVLDKQLFFETHLRRQRSGVTSSLIRKINEELKRLKHMSGSVKQVHELSNFMANIPNLDTTISIRRDAPVFGDHEHKMWNSNKYPLTKVYRPLNSKLYRSCGVHKRGFKANVINKKCSRILKSNNKLIKGKMHSTLAERLVDTRCVNNTLVYTFGRFCDSKDNKNSFNSFIKSKNFKATENFWKSLSLQNIGAIDKDETCGVKRHTVSCNDFTSTFKEIEKVKPKHKSRYSISSRRCQNRNRSNWETDLVKESSVPMKEKCEPKDLSNGYATRLSKARVYGLITPLKPKYAFLIDLIYSGKHFDPSQSIILNQCKRYLKQTSSEMRPFALKTYHVNLKHGLPTRNYFSYVYKVPVKINKKKIVLKVVVDVIVKGRRDQFSSNPMNAASCNKHTLYYKQLQRFGSVRADNSFKTSECYKSSLKYSKRILFPLEDDETVHQSFAPNFNGFPTYSYGYDSAEMQTEINKAILNECLCLTNGYLKKNRSKSYCESLPRLVQWLKSGSGVLSTITEEPFEDLNGYLEKSQEANGAAGDACIFHHTREQNCQRDSMLQEELWMEDAHELVVKYSRDSGRRTFCLDNSSISIINCLGKPLLSQSGKTMTLTCSFDLADLGNIFYEGVFDPILSESTTNGNVGLTREVEAVNVPTTSQTTTEIWGNSRTIFGYAESLCFLENAKRASEAEIKYGDVVTLELSRNSVSQPKSVIIIEDALFGPFEDTEDKNPIQRSSTILFERGEFPSLGDDEPLKENSETSFEEKQKIVQDNVNCCS